MGQLVAVAAVLALVALLWRAFRFAMALRYSKLEREAAARRLEASGRRIVAEIPLESGAIELLTEDGSRFHWRDGGFAKDAVIGGRLLLNGGIMKEFAAAPLPAADAPEEFDGRERWQVDVYLLGDAVFAIPCGRLREGVSREAALAAFAAVRAAWEQTEGR